MTIKQRLFISNIFMILLPLVLNMAMSGIIFYTFDQITGVDAFSIRQGGISIADPQKAEAMISDGDYTEVEADVSVYQSDAGGYVVVVPFGTARVHGDNGPPFGVMPAVMLFLLIVIVFLTNLVLTRIISRSIMSSVKKLVDGVRQISEGNLTYRIEHNTGDEFDAVCADFNEMASRLSDMVRQRQADENSRKELIAGISHDLRTPLTSIKAYIEGLKKGVASTPEMQEKYINTIQSKTGDLEYIVRQLYLFSKMDIGEFPFNFETVDIGRELDKMIAGLSGEYAERGLSISLTENTEGVNASIDVVSFGNVLQNVLNNSVKYGNKEDNRVEIRCGSDGHTVSIAIADNGPGVPEDALARIFDIFYRGDVSRNNPSGGSGLGLAISSKIIKRMDGTLTAENAPGGGLCIIISLPVERT